MLTLAYSIRYDALSTIIHSNKEIVALNLADGDFFILYSEVYKIFKMTRLIEYFNICRVVAAWKE